MRRVITMLINMIFGSCLFLFVLLMGVFLLYKGSIAQEKVSAFGRYEGYSEAI